MTADGQNLRCSCPDEELGGPPRATVKSLTVQAVPGLSEKARIFPDTGVVQVDRDWWAGLGHLQKAAVLAHELAHQENVETCEDCTDARAGALLRYQGVSARAACDAIRSVVSTRHRAPDSVLRGWQSADRAIKARGQTSAGLRNSQGAVAVAPSSPAFPTPAPSGSPYTGRARVRAFEGEDEERQQSVGLPAGIIVPDAEAVTGGDLARRGNPAATPSAGQGAPKPPSSGAETAAAILAALAILVLLVAVTRSVQ